ncbi:MAG TPA: SCO family protein, partial [Azonexus sp.]|nr:SCO family protein [Azonexus sp.]
MHRLTARLAMLLLSCILLAACSPAPQGSKPAGADFVLQGPSGPVDSHDFRGKLMLVFFGYVHCPDVCPTSLAAMNEVLNGMTPEERAKIQPVLISVDP